MENQETTKLLYDQPRKMSQKQLELAWLASIWEEPEHCRKTGLSGLDSTMFEHKLLFEIGLEILRDQNHLCRADTSADLILKMAPLGLISRIEKAFEIGSFLPAFYKVYCDEIERRAELKNLEEPEWN